MTSLNEHGRLLSVLRPAPPPITPIDLSCKAMWTRIRAIETRQRDMTTSVGGTMFPLTTDAEIIKGLPAGHDPIFQHKGTHPTPPTWGASIAHKGDRPAMKRKMAATVADAVATLRASQAGLGTDYNSIRSWLGDFMVTTSLDSMVPSVSANTADQYDVSVRQYFEFCSHAGETPWRDPFLLHLSDPEKVLWLTCWLHWQTARGSNLAQSCSGLRKFFETNGQPVDFFDDPKLKEVKASARLSAADYLALRQRTEKSVVPVEFLWTVMHHFGPRADDDRSAFDQVKEVGLVAMVMYEYGYGLRISNLAVSGGRTTHTLISDHVIFHFENPDDVNALPRAMYAHELWQHKGEHWCTTESLISVTMTHPTGKNWGSRRQPKKSPVVNTVQRTVPAPDSDTEMLTGGFQDQLTVALFNHAVSAQLRPGQFFFSVNRGHLNPRSKSLNNPLGNYKFQASDSAGFVKFASEAHGLPPSQFSTTSWRATCATVLSSMGETYLKMFGNWSSDVYLRYIRSVGKQTSAGDLPGISLKRIATQIPIESQRAFDATRSSAGQPATLPAQAFTSAVAALPAGFRVLFAPPTLGAQFRYKRGDYASASSSIQQLPPESHDRLILMMRTDELHLHGITHRSAPDLSTPTAPTDRAEIPRVPEPRFCQGPPLPSWPRPALDLSGAGWTQLLATRAREAAEWTTWLHQSHWCTTQPDSSMIGALRPSNYEQWEPVFDLARGTVRFPFDDLPRSCCITHDSTAYAPGVWSQGRYPYTPCAPSITGAQARLFEEEYGPDIRPEDDPVFSNAAPPHGD